MHEFTNTLRLEKKSQAPFFDEGMDEKHIQLRTPTLVGVIVDRESESAIKVNDENQEVPCRINVAVQKALS